MESETALHLQSMIREAENPEIASIDQQLTELRQLKRELLYREEDLTQRRMELVREMGEA